MAPARAGRYHGPKLHDGTIQAELPDQMWGTDATRVWTPFGYVWIFMVVDHCAGDCVGAHASLAGNRYEALVPVQEGVREHFGRLAAGAAAGLQVRHDHASQYMSEAFQAEPTFIGAESSPSLVASPEGKGVADRFIRTLKEQLLWAESLSSLEELRRRSEASGGTTTTTEPRAARLRHAVGGPEETQAAVTEGGTNLKSCVQLTGAGTEDPLQPVERQEVGILRSRHVGIDRGFVLRSSRGAMRRRDALDHDPLGQRRALHCVARRAGVLWIPVAAHHELRRDDVSAFADVLADPFHRLATVGAGALLFGGVEFDDLARQAMREWLKLA